MFRRHAHGWGPALAAVAVLAAVAPVAGCGGVWSPGHIGDGTGASSGGAGGTAAADGMVTLAVGPGDAGAAVLSAIESAREEIVVSTYLLTSSDAIAALIGASQGGRRVVVLLERHPFGQETGNEPAYAQLAAAGIDVRWVARPQGLHHVKMILVDRATLLVMTLNLTDSGLGRNREYMTALRGADEVARAEAILAADLAASEPARALRPSAIAMSPEDARARLGSAIASAEWQIVIEVEELSDAAMTAGLIAAHSRGVAVGVIAPAFDRSEATSAALAKLRAAGVDVRTLANPPLHAKAMVVDSEILYVGSMNFTRASLDDNRELGVLVNSPSLAARVAQVIGADLLSSAPF